MNQQEIDELAWPIVSSPLKSGEGQILVREFRWSERIDGHNVMIVVPPGFIWDGASIPRWAWSLIGSPFTGEYQQASLVHDALYDLKSYWTDGQWAKPTRKFADNLFRTMMIDDGVEEDKAILMWKVVRLTGKYAWDT
jgi:hypothetical protein